ncbi:uncharacterized protein Dwil_GK28060 [Drosophila willistoni]|uniref:Uncharacterized protein n=1 Tax=Drosophila willistoni TaxID=7260 RepID=A0A0Q9X0X3_DROWI|nr:uncharacterized protein Dwil_GK28060 [Drosophila willistoni]
MTYLLKFGVILTTIIECRFEFTNLKCTSLDKSFLEFQHCYIKAVNRSYKYITIRANVFDLPVYEAITNFDLLKRNNGYLPFLYNITGPVCPFFENKKRFPVSSFITGLFLEHSNFNHRCPFNHDFIVDKLDIGFLNGKFTKLLPFPEEL